MSKERDERVIAMLWPRFEWRERERERESDRGREGVCDLTRWLKDLAVSDVLGAFQK